MSANFAGEVIVGEVGEVQTRRAKQGKTKLAEDDGKKDYKENLNNYRLWDQGRQIAHTKP